jgi:hypothetical protein
MCYARAGMIRPPWRWDRIDWTRPPAYAAPGAANANHRRIAAPIAAAASPTEPPKPVAPKPAAGWKSTFSRLNRG